VGQVVAEAIALYQRHFWRALALGVPLAVVDQLIVGRSAGTQIAILVAASPVFSLTYAAACAIDRPDPPPRRVWLTAVLVGTLTFLPVAAVFTWFKLAAVLWLGVAAHAVPAVMAERLRPLAALRRSWELARADYVHAAGSFATLVLLFGLTQIALGFVLRGQADATLRVSLFLADLALSPLLYLGGAIVYVDLVARVGLDREERRQLREAALGARPPAK
jgi:hypothetical protein